MADILRNYAFFIVFFLFFFIFNHEKHVTYHHFFKPILNSNIIFINKQTKQRSPLRRNQGIDSRTFGHLPDALPTQLFWSCSLESGQLGSLLANRDPAENRRYD